MSFNLMESVKSVLSGEEINNLAGVLGENSFAVQQAVNTVIPAIFTGVLLKSGTEDTQETLNLATDASRVDISLDLNSQSGILGTSRGADFLKSLFGDKTPGLTESIADYSGLNHQSAATLLSIAAPVALGVLGKHILDTNMNASGLRSFLNSQKKKILNALPAGIFLNGVIGIEDVSGLSEKWSDSEPLQKNRNPVSRWVWFTLAGLSILAIILYFLNRTTEPEPVTTPNENHVSVRNDSNLVRPAAPASPSQIKLPDGVALDAKKGGLEDQLVAFFLDPNTRPSRRFPFSFDRLSFNDGSAVITNESMVQIQNVALILKAFPNAKIKIGGFNKKGDDSMLNKALSENRAAAVSAALKSAGAAPDQITGVEGFGSDFAKYPADAADSLKEKDSRISLSVRGK